MDSTPLYAEDVAQITAHGLTTEDVLRQIHLFKNPPRHVKLVRPCLPGSGIRVLDDAQAHACVAAFETACAHGRFLKFVRASGVASRSSRTLFEEHLVEAAAYMRDRDGVCRLHFVVLPSRLERFQQLLERVRPAYEARCAARFQVSFSTLYPCTDTVAVDRDNRPLRDATGALLFRKGGHGALLENLSAMRGDLVFIKNIDNVVPEDRKGPSRHWKKVLGGHLVQIQSEIFRHVALLSSPPSRSTAIRDALHFVREVLSVEVPTHVVGAGADVLHAFLIAKLDRPLRVCGMVRSDDNLGGGPFWVKGRDDTSTLQIVEAAQVDPGAPDQQAVLRAATHFNPVDLVCGVRDWRGVPFDLRRYVDPSAVFIAQKSSGGRTLKALKHPGLWNGAMADWNTVFVEVPAATFRPVKTANASLG